MTLIQQEPPVYLLGENPTFPDLLDGNVYDDLVAVGGDFNPIRLVNAYKNGYFPWYIENGLIYWFSPDPRLIVDANSLKVSKSLRKTLNREIFEVKFNTNFQGVIEGCSKIKRVHEDSTWISDEFIEAYTQLHKLGFAVSVESYYEGELVGGLYGLHMGNIFFGESMFAKKSDASKVAFVSLAETMFKLNRNSFIDCQTPSEHLSSLGGYEIFRDFYLHKLKEGISYNTLLKEKI